MRVDLRAYGVAAPDKAKTDLAGKTPGSATHESGAAGTDHARFSFDQARVKTLEAAVMAQPEVRQQKVDAIRQAVGKGEYAVSDAQIADAISADFGAAAGAR
jgi:flagellar biosynthesis anti-sigma factor FlgM